MRGSLFVRFSCRTARLSFRVSRRRRFRGRKFAAFAKKSEKSLWPRTSHLALRTSHLALISPNVYGPPTHFSTFPLFHFSTPPRALDNQSTTVVEYLRCLEKVDFMDFSGECLEALNEPETERQPKRKTNHEETHVCNRGGFRRNLPGRCDQR